jgi:uncharacterized protein (TIGR03000 family)
MRLSPLLAIEEKSAEIYYLPQSDQFPSFLGHDWGGTSGMYSVILMVALTSGGTAPDLGFGVGCNSSACSNGVGGSGFYGVETSCHGCHGYDYYGSARSNYNPSPARSAKGAETKEKESARPAKAILTVELPADAKLTIGEQLMTSSAAVRTFSTPELEPTMSYTYILRAEVVRDGKTYRETKKVVVRAGEQIRTSLTNLQPAVSVAAKNETSP